MQRRQKEKTKKKVYPLSFKLHKSLQITTLHTLKLLFRELDYLHHLRNLHSLLTIQQCHPGPSLFPHTKAWVTVQQPAVPSPNNLHKNSISPLQQQQISHHYDCDVQRHKNLSGLLEPPPPSPLNGDYGRKKAQTAQPRTPCHQLKSSFLLLPVSCSNYTGELALFCIPLGMM